VTRTEREQPRFLHRDPSRNYTEQAHLGARGEPEAVPVDFQREVTARAHRAWASESAASLGEAAQTIQGAQRLRGRCRDRHLANDPHDRARVGRAAATR
jgi:hypothetical protein